MTPTEIARAISKVIPDGATTDTLQVIMLGPDMVEVKARITAGGNWFQGVVHRRDWENQ